MKRIINRWSEEELNILKNLYLSTSQRKIAIILHRTKKSVNSKLSRLGLKVSEEERRRRTVCSHKNTKGQWGKDNPNWKGGVSKDHKRYSNRFNAKFPEKHRAHVLLKYAVKQGKILRLPCTVCGDVNSFAHHEDYTKPLEVVWLCRKHHREKHGGKH